MKYTLFLFLVLLFACSPSAGPEQDSSNMDEAKQAIDTGHEAFLTAMRTNDTEALLAQLTDDVIFLPPKHRWEKKQFDPGMMEFSKPCVQTISQ